MADDNAETIREIEETLESGITSTSADGHSVSVDLQHLQRKQRDLRLQDADSISAGKIKPPVVGLNLGGAW